MDAKKYNKNLLLNIRRVLGVFFKIIFSVFNAGIYILGFFMFVGIMLAAIIGFEDEDASDAVIEKKDKEFCLEKGFYWNLDNKECLYEFNFNDCHKLEGNWKYPKACE